VNSPTENSELPKPAESAADADNGPEEEASEIERVLGDKLRSPVKIPKAYTLAEASTHEIFQIELADFAGPLDLLLFLIRKHEIEILDIPIAFITEKYIEMIENLSSLPIDVAAEFLVMAAELAHIKSKMLLPPEEGIPVEETEEEQGDPRADLVRRLLEYQKYRDAAHDLADFDQLNRDVFARTPELLSADEDFDPGLRSGNIFKLVDTMAEILSRLEPEVQHQVEADPGTVSDRVLHAISYGKQHGNRFSFWDLLKEVKTRQMIVLTFIAILEMARTKVIKIEIEEPEESSEGEDGPAAGNIVLVLTGNTPPNDLLNVESESFV